MNYFNKTIAFSLLGISFSALSNVDIGYDKPEVSVSATQLSEHSFYLKGNAGHATSFNGFISNSGFVITKEGVVVYDALGTPSLANEMIKEIRKVTNLPIKTVVVSHYHADHIYGLQVFKNEGAEIWAPKGVYDYLDSETSTNLLESRKNSLYPWVNEDTYLVKPDVIIDKDTTFKLGNSNFVINYLGKVHSEGDMTLLFKNEGVLFSGDIIFEGRVPFVGDANIFNWIKTLDKIKNLNPDIFVPGHGTASNNPIETMELTTNYLNFLLTKLKPFIEDMEEFDVAYNNIDWSSYENLPAFDQSNRKNALAVFLFLERNT